MNKIYKLIWSQTANAFVAVSELASARGKSSSTTNNAVSSADKKAGIFKPVKTALVLSMLFVLPHSVMAGTGLAGGTATGIDAIAIGERSNASGVLSTALGVDSVAQEKYATALGQAAQALGDDSAAVGTRAKALAHYSTALGNQSTATKEFDLAVGYNAIASGGQSAAVGFAAKSTGNSSNAIGGSSVAAGEYSTALGQEAHAKADFTLAAGYKANASGEQSTAVGFGSQSTGIASNAIGGASVAAGEFSTALGQEAQAKAGFTLAAGYKANASGEQSTAVGFGSKSTGYVATALGSASVAAGDFSVAIGQESETAAGKNFATALGYKAKANGWASFAQGSFALASGDGSISMGDSSSATGKNATAIGGKASATSEGAQALGNQSNASGYQSNAIGAQAAASDYQSNAIGAQAAASGKASNAIGWSAKATAQDATAIGSNAQAYSRNGIAMGTNATVSGEKSVAIGIGSKTGTGTGMVAIGDYASTDNKSAKNTSTTQTQSNSQSVAIGSLAQAWGDQSVSIGNNTRASGNSSVAIGGDDIDKVRNQHQGLYRSITGKNMPSGYVSTESSGAGATAIGVMTTASGHFASALGMTAEASGDGSVAIGPVAKSSGEAGVAIGIESQASSRKTIAIGSVATATAENATAMGYQSKASGIASNAIGWKANAMAQDATAIGTEAKAQAARSIAMGYQSTTNAAGPSMFSTASIAIGEMASTDNRSSENTNNLTKNQYNRESIAIGAKAKAFGDQSTALGNDVKASGNSSIAIGGDDIEKVREEHGDLYWRITGQNMPGGYYSTESSGAGSTAIGVMTTASGHFASALGMTANASGNGSVALGPTAESSGEAGVAIGIASQASSIKTIAIGSVATATAENATAMGYQSKASGIASNAIGRKANATAQNATAIGFGAKAYSGSGIAMGTNAEAGSAGSENTLVQAVAIGRDAKAKAQSQDVALGAYSETSAVANTQNTQIDGKTYTYAGTNAKSTLSVGKSGAERTITNVAAGRISDTSTDAINGSQLYGTNQAINSLAGDVDTLGNTTAAAIGGNSTYNPSNHTVSVPTYNINNQNVSTVSGAINKLNEGWNLTSNGNSTAAVRTNDTVDIGTATGETNLIVAKNGNTIDYSLNKKLDLGATGSVNAGGTVINNNGLSFVDSNGATLANTPSIKKDGINAGGQQIANVKAGTGDTDAVNVSQLKKAQAAATTKVAGDKGVSVTPTTNADGSTTYTVAAKTDNKTVKVDGNGNIAAVTAPLTTNTDGKVNTPAAPNALATAGDIANAINNSGWKLAADGTTGTELINPSDTVTFKTGSSNLTVKRDGANITYDLARNINVDSVQIGANGPKITNDGNNIKIGDKDGNATKITNVAAGTGNTDAVNVSQLKAAQAAATTKVEGDKGVSVTPTTNADGSKTYTVAAKTDNTTVKVDDKGNIAAVTAPLTYTDGKVNTPAAPNALATAGDIANAINNSGWKLAADGTSGTELINPSDTVTFKTGSSNLTVKRDGANIAYDLAKDININSVNVGDTVKINKDGINAGNTVIDGVKSGNIAAGSGQAVNGGQVHNIAESIADALGGESKVNADGSIAKPTYTITKTDGTTVTANSVGGALNYFNKEIVKPITFAGDSGSYEAQLGHTVNVKGDGKNITTSVSGNNLTIKMTDTPEFSSVTTGGTVMNSNGITTGNGKGPSLTTTGINAAGTKITNVANGTEAGDAVNYGQLSAVSNNLNNRINDVDRSSRAGIAGALATAGLYQAYLPGKSMVSVGGGTFRGENAVAIGLSRISDNGKIGIKLSGMSTSQGDTGGSVSVGYQW